MTAPHETLPVLVTGEGDPIVLLHGFGLSARTYAPPAHDLGALARVIVPDLFELPGRWSYRRASEALGRTLDELTDQPATLVGHSFGGAVALEFTARHPDRVRELVFLDSAGLTSHWRLLRDALTTPGLLQLASWAALVDFGRTTATHPLRLARAGWFAFFDGREEFVLTVRRNGTPCHVVWASHDTLLPRRDGQEFAGQLGADFHVVSGPEGESVGHDWVFQRPDLVRPVLQQLGLRALGHRARSSASAELLEPTAEG